MSYKSSKAWHASAKSRGGEKAAAVASIARDIFKLFAGKP
jgi:hypothetical protein